MVIKLNRRHREILSIILNTDGCITGNELAKLCNVTIRTIRQDIKDINFLLKEYNIEVDSSIKKGYFLNKENKQILKKHNIIRKVLDYEYIIETPNLPMDRQICILLKLTTKEYISVEELADFLYVSAATINNDIILINKWLKKDLNLRISYSLNNGITLKANEKEKRNIISWVLSIKTNVSTISKYWNYLFEEKDIIKKARELFHIVNAETKKYNYYLSGHSSQLLCYEILLAVNRHQLGNDLNGLDYINGSLISVIISIKEKVKKELGINLPEIEWINLQQCFKSKQFLYKTDITKFKTDEVTFIVEEFVKVLNEKFNINLNSEPINKHKLILYVSPMINRLKYKHCIPEKISEKVIQIHKTEFKMASEIVHIIKEKLSLNVSLVELAYITIHLVYMCGLWKHKLNTIIVCDYDESILSFIKDKIKYIFGEKINISRSYDYQEFMYEKQENLKGVEFIITTSTIADITNIPFVKINPEIESNDIDMITDYINNRKNKL